VTYKVIQGQWQWCHTIYATYDFLFVFHCNCLAQLTRYITYFPKLKRSRDSEHTPFWTIYHACNSTSVYQSAHKIFKCLATPHILGQTLKQMGHVTLTTPIMGQTVIPKLVLDIFYPHTKFGNSHFSVPEI